MKQKLLVGSLLSLALLPVMIGSVPTKADAQLLSIHRAKKPRQPRLTLDHQGLVLDALLEKVSLDFPDYRDYKEEGPVYGRGFFSRLSSQYGFTYAKRSLPTLIYQELAPYFADRLSQEKFLQTWDETIQLATRSDFERAFTKNLKNKKVPASLAVATAKVVATLVSELV